MMQLSACKMTNEVGDLVHVLVLPALSQSVTDLGGFYNPIQKDGRRRQTSRYQDNGEGDKQPRLRAEPSQEK